MRIKLLRPVRLALTLGEPAGVGPDLCIMMAQLKQAAEVVVIGSADLIHQRANLLNLPVMLADFDPTLEPVPGRLSIIDIPVQKPVIPGKLDPHNSAYVINSLQTAYRLCESGACDALVTLPVHKAIISQSGYPFMGHTEFFAQCANVSDVLMTFYTPLLLLSLVTTHCALNQVSEKITPQRLRKVIELLHHGLVEIFDKPHAKIRVLGLNPHAGEQGTLGQQEQHIITPVIQALQQQGYRLEGPVSADTAFIPERLHEIDAMIAMYHDQGLNPIKALYFGKIVNLTLGLPFLRASVDHGTALPLAGTTKASIDSLLLALQTTADLATVRRPVESVIVA